MWVIALHSLMGMKTLVVPWYGLACVQLRKSYLLPMKVDKLIHKSCSLHVDNCYDVLEMSNFTAELHYTRSIGLDQIIVRRRSVL